MGDQNSITAYFESYGRALSGWQHVESSLFYVAHRILDTAPQYTSIIFFQIKSPEARVRLVDGLVKECFAPEGVGNWKAICTELLKLVTERNKLAHNETLIDILQLQEDIEIRPSLADPFLRFASIHDQKQPKSYYADDLNLLAERFNQAAARVNDFLLSKFPDASVSTNHAARDRMLSAAISRKVRRNSEKAEK